MAPSSSALRLAASLAFGCLVSMSAGQLQMPPVDTKFKQCGDKSPLLKVTAVDISAVVPGEPLSVAVSGVPQVDIPDKDIAAEVQIFVLGFKLAHADFDFCTEMKGVTCPLVANQPFKGTTTYTIPKEAPSGVELGIRIIVNNAATDQLYTCVEMDVKVQARLGTQYEATLPAVTPALVATVNERASSWTAHYSPRFHQYTIEDARRIAGGTFMRGHKDYVSLPARKYPRRRSGGAPHGAVDVNTPELAGQFSFIRKASGGGGGDGGEDDIPAEFDARKAWPQCAAVIGRVRDQSDCGACWAFASTEAFNDRRCIAALARDGAPDATVLSAEDTLSCCSGLRCGFSMGCNGGQPGAAWRWFKHRGVVSGLDYADVDKGTSCKPYEFQPCAHHVDPAASGYPECPSGEEYQTPKCTDACTDAMFATAFDDDKRFATDAYSLRSVEDIQRDMLAHGPVTAAFSVYSDFLAYKGGVYEHVAGSYMGGHAVKIIGWGTDGASGKDYWLIVNSWNESWGESGAFRILRGDNHCGIESGVVAGEA